MKQITIPAKETVQRDARTINLAFIKSLWYKVELPVKKQVLWTKCCPVQTVINRHVAKL